MVVNEIHGNALMRMLSVTYNTHTSRIIMVEMTSRGWTALWNAIFSTV